MKVVVPNMTCGHCKMKIENSLKDNGFDKVVIDLDAKTVEIDLAGKSEDLARQAIESKGYKIQ